MRKLSTPLTFSLCLIILSSCNKETPTQTPPPEPSPEESLKASTIEVTPETLVLDHHGGISQLSVTVKDQHGNAMNNISITWASSDEEIAQVDSQSKVTAYKPGEATLTATVESLTAEVKVTVELQMNPQCEVPTEFPVHPAVGGIPSFSYMPGYFDLPPPKYDMAEPATGDFDGDGDEDIIIFSSNFPPNPDAGEVRFWRNTGTSFEDATLEVFGTESLRAQHTRHTEVADLNGDGVADVFAVQHGYDSSLDGAPELLLLSQPGGTMREMAATNLNPYETTNYSHASAAGDIDCDGDVDIFAGSGGGRHGAQTNHLYINDGSGFFTADDSRLPEDAADPTQIQVTSGRMCDLDRDGDQDFFLGGSSLNASALLLNNGFGEFRHATSAKLPPSYYEVENDMIDVQCTDLNLDGWNDLLVSVGYSPARFEIWMNQGDLTFEDITAEVAPNETEDNWAWRLPVVDFNSDGWPDFFVSTIDENDQIYLNQGGTGYTVLNPPENMNNLMPIEANGDGRTDLYWTGTTADDGTEYEPVFFRNQ